MRKTTVLLAIAAFALGGLVGAYALLAERPLERGVALGAVRPAWSEMQWPFPMDQWGKGKAFRCKSADCGGTQAKSRGRECNVGTDEIDIDDGVLEGKCRRRAVGDRGDRQDDCGGLVVTLCRTETETGQTIVIDSGQYFH